MTVVELMQRAPVIPVIVIDDAEDAVELGRALVAGGLPVLEITLRTPAALAALEKIAVEIPEAITGVGTVTSVEQIQQAVDAGAKFAVSPGFSPMLADACEKQNLPFLPGVMTPTDILSAQAAGCSALKFFPAKQAGGIAALKALAGPFPDIVFCPTGGITASDYRDYLALDNVLCVGGSWVAPKQAVRDGQWNKIQALASECG